MNVNSNPYLQLPSSAFWRSAVIENNPFQIDNLWRPKFPISQRDQVITAGSCFAQHIGRALQSNGFSWFDAEPTPIESINSIKYNYGVFSFRTGNIYTVALLKQWINWSISGCDSVEFWVSDGGCQDPFRPVIEPKGFSSPTEMYLSRLRTLDSIRIAISRAEVFVFTLGLTEAWLNDQTGHVYPMAPGTVGGIYDDQIHYFKNFGFSEIMNDIRWVLAAMRSLNPKLKVLLTVSPVPLAATASGNHVLAATTYSKSVLRAVAGELSQELDFVDYFPSYEIITSPIFRGIFYMPNGRDICRQGVDHVMKQFFSGLGFSQKSVAHNSEISSFRGDGNDVYCEEAMLSAFGEDK